ncbi:MAG: NPCBM/NEW2 domain-containing protein, partial [Acidobacteriota bacterium]
MNRRTRRPGFFSLHLAALGAGMGAAALCTAGALARPAPQEVTAAMIHGDQPPANGVWVEDVGLEAMFQRRGRPVAGGVGGGRGGPRPITLGGQVYRHGIGTQSISEFVIDVKGQATRFVAMVGLDDSVSYEQAS